MEINKFKNLEISINPTQPIWGKSTDKPEYAEKSVETSFSYDKEANMFVSKFVDKNNGNVKQYPPEQMLAIARQIGKVQGNTIDVKA